MTPDNNDRLASGPASGKINLPDAGAAVAVFLLAAIAFTMADSFNPDAAMFPKIVSGIMAFAAILLFVKSFFARSRQERKTGSGEARVWIALLITTVYVALVEPLGYITSSLIFFPVMARFAGMRSGIPLALATIGLVLGFYFLFGRVFQTPLPEELILQFLN